MPEATPQATPGRTLEAYPAHMRNCPNCDAPYGAVHGPGCPLDPEHAPWMRQLLAKLDAVIADNGRLRQEAAGLREQLLRTEEQCRRHVNQADAGAARWKAERDEAREEVAQWQARHEALAVRLDEAGVQLITAHVDGERMRTALERIRDHADRWADGRPELDELHAFACEALEGGQPAAGGSGAARGDSKPYGPGISLPWEIRETRVTIWDMP